MKTRTLTAGAVALFAAVALTFSGASLAAPKTTTPTVYRVVSVVLSDKGIKLGWYSVSRTHDGYLPVPNFIPRGDYVSFSVVNVGKKRHNFVAFGHKTAALKHGQKTHFSVAATIRGRFPYASALDKGKTFHGFIDVV